MKLSRLILCAAIAAGCAPQLNDRTRESQILAVQSYEELKSRCSSLHKACGSHEEALRRLSDAAKVRYLFCKPSGLDEQTLNRTIKNLSFNSIGSVLDLLPSRDARTVTELREFRQLYFRQRVPYYYFGNEEASTLEFEYYTRRIIDEFICHYKEYDNAGKIALARLLHAQLTYPGSWSNVPAHVEFNLAAHIVMNLLPWPQQFADSARAEPWLLESRGPRLAIELISQTEDKRYITDVIRFIKEAARDSYDRNSGFRALLRLKAKGEDVEKFLVEALQNEEWRDNAEEILNAMAITGSRHMDRYLLPYIGGKNHTLWAMAAHTYRRLPDFEKRVASLPRQKQIQIFLIAEYGTDTPQIDDGSLFKRIRRDEAQELVNTFDLSSFRNNASLATQAVILFKDQANRTTVQAVIQLLDDLYYSGEGLNLWLTFGIGVEYLQQVSGQTFWSPAYPHGVTAQSPDHKHTREELKETMEKIHAWWNANRAKFPHQVLRARTM
jgi:hypothetical protein